MAHLVETKGGSRTVGPATSAMILNPNLAGTKVRPVIGLSQEERAKRLIELGKTFGHVEREVIFSRQRNHMG